MKRHPYVEHVPGEPEKSFVKCRSWVRSGGYCLETGEYDARPPLSDFHKELGISYRQTLDLAKRWKWESRAAAYDAMVAHSLGEAANPVGKWSAVLEKTLAELASRDVAELDPNALLRIVDAASRQLESWHERQASRPVVLKGLTPQMLERIEPSERDELERILKKAAGWT